MVTSARSNAKNDGAVAPDAGLVRAWQALGEVLDPEIPVISVVDLAIVRHVHVGPKGDIEVGLAPTYSGCPATSMIQAQVIAALKNAGFERVTIVEVLSPPWTSDWISAEARDKLRAYGIAPPAESVSSPRRLVHAPLRICCPRCGSGNSSETSRFGSTPCKALHRCNDCLEPFEYFKCI
jgi:ring-1,2-phenylacetyl-CoA epoxidase subunit PaaD